MESNTRKGWRTRIRAIVEYEKEHGFDATDVEAWLDDLMQTPELEKAEFAESVPEYQVKVVEEWPWDEKAWQEGLAACGMTDMHSREYCDGYTECAKRWHEWGYRRVVKMDGEPIDKHGATGP